MATRLSISTQAPGAFHFVNVADLHIDYTHNGRRFQPSPERIKELAESIVKFGQLEPILIRKLADNVYTPIAGFTRCAAVALINTDPDLRAKAGLADEQILPIRAITQQTNEQDAFLRNLVENHERNATSPMDDAHNQNILRERYGWTNTQIAEFYHCSPAWVSSLSNLLNLDEKHQRLVHEEALSPRNGIELSRLMPDVRDEVIESATTTKPAPAKPDKASIPTEPMMLDGKIDGLGGVDFDALDRMDLADVEAEQAEAEPVADQPTETVIDNKALSKKIAQARGKSVGLSLKEIKDTLREIAENQAHSDDARAIFGSFLQLVLGEAQAEDVLDLIEKLS